MRQVASSIFFKEHQLNVDEFPYFYMESYGSFLHITEDKNIIVIYDEFLNSVVCSYWNNKFLKKLQPLYPPLTKSAQRLCEVDEKKFLDNLISFITDNKLYHRVLQTGNAAIFKTSPSGSTCVPFGTYYLDLENHTEEELLINQHHKHRYNASYAQRKGVELKYGYEVISDFHALYKQTMDRSNMYCESLNCFEELFKYNKNNVICVVAYYNNIPQGGLFIPFSNFAGFYVYGASSAEMTITGTINYLHWDTIKLLKLKGVKRYDFVGARLSDVTNTRLSGIQQFKERFGASLEKGFMWKIDINKFYCYLFDLLIRVNYKIKNKKPLLDIVDQELLKSVKTFKKITLLSRIKIKLSCNRTQCYKKARRFKKKVVKDSLIESLTSVGIKKGDVLMVHSSLSKIGNVSDGSNTVISALLEQIGPEGNLLMPAYSYIHSMKQTADCKDYIFDPLTTPSVVGKITEEFRKWPEVKRSIHPTHSVCAYGPLAESITAGHLQAETNFGIDTPFNCLKELNGKIVGIGIGLGPVTIYHNVEDLNPEEFKNIYYEKPSTINVLVDGKVFGKSIFIHNSIIYTDRIDKSKITEMWLTNHFRKIGILHEGTFGDSIIWWMNVKDLCDELIILNKKGISINKIPSNEQG